MKIEKLKCESCDKETADWMMTKGWICINADYLSISDGMGSHGISEKNRGFDFCSIGCFERFMYSLIYRKGES